ncbi:MAG TPA: NAD(P)H-binding protein [Solirubrobacterales bacterium]|nr:NAD(P)H-binding protein [Solirubrobacterales bacterium]
MKAAVVGGTGVLGAPIVAGLAARGDDVLILSRKPPRELPAGAGHRSVDLTDGAGLDEALTGVEVVVDASNSSPRDAGPVLVEGTRRLLGAAAQTGVRHYVGVSIVGCERVPTGYYKVKARQEEEIAAGEVPWSLLRATQFHQLLDWGFGQAARFRLRPTGRARLQPIAAAVVAERLVEVAHLDPAGRLPEIAGPEVQTLSELSSAWRRAKGRAALPVRIPSIGKIGRPVGEGALCNPDAAAGGPSFTEWLAAG